MTLDDADLAKSRRALIDLIATTRARSVRVALFGSLLHRPDPDGAESAEEREAQVNVLIDTVRWIERVAVLLEKGTDPWNEIPDNLCQWVFTFVDERPVPVKKIREMANISSAVANAAKVGATDLGQALRDHYAIRRDGFMDAVTEFCDGIWAAIDQERDEDIARAAATGKAIQIALSRLEGIGKHVRLVSLNASVEAARIGESGLGIGVIASEFKTLAEEIQALAVSASTDISNLTSRNAESNSISHNNRATSGHHL